MKCDVFSFQGVIMSQKTTKTLFCNADTNILEINTVCRCLQLFNSPEIGGLLLVNRSIIHSFRDTDKIGSYQRYNV